jgi:hypothetical protein
VLLWELSWALLSGQLSEWLWVPREQLWGQLWGLLWGLSELPLVCLWELPSGSLLGCR